jgi:hypothetical protein
MSLTSFLVEKFGLLNRNRRRCQHSVQIVIIPRYLLKIHVYDLDTSQLFRCEQPLKLLSSCSQKIRLATLTLFQTAEAAQGIKIRTHDYRRQTILGTRFETILKLRSPSHYIYRFPFKMLWQPCQYALQNRGLIKFRGQNMQ